jgi:hypothetical protein
MKYIMLILLCLSCGEDNFQKVERLESFRVLGVEVDSPEVVPGIMVTLKVLASDVTGSGIIPGTYEACIDPGISRGATVSCDHDPSKVSGTYNLDLQALNQRTGLAAPLTVTVPATILTGRTAEEQFNGVGYIVIFRFTVNGRESSAFKRIIATTRPLPELNTNPSGSALFLNGGTMAIPQKGDELSLTTSAPESYDVIIADGSVETRTEKFEVAWYASSGNFDKSKAFVDETVEFQGDTPPAFILAVVRDERGGFHFVRFPEP